MLRRFDIADGIVLKQLFRDGQIFIKRLEGGQLSCPCTDLVASFIDKVIENGIDLTSCYTGKKRSIDIVQRDILQRNRPLRAQMLVHAEEQAQIRQIVFHGRR